MKQASNKNLDVLSKIEIFSHLGNEIVGVNIDRFRAIYSGYLRGIPYIKLKKLFLMILNNYKFHTNEIENKFIENRIVTCFIEHPNNKYLQSIVKRCMFLLCSKNHVNSHKKIAAILNKLFNKCNLQLQTTILKFFLDSKKKSLRKYVYKKRLDLFPEDILKNAFACILEYPEESTCLLDTMVKKYDNYYIECNFYEIINHPEISDDLIRIAFLKKQVLKKSDWIWLKDSWPQNVLYLAAKREYQLTNDECERYAIELVDNIDMYNFGLVYWALAKLDKLDIIPKINGYIRTLEKHKNY